jgi:hypothetical protein
MKTLFAVLALVLVGSLPSAGQSRPATRSTIAVPKGFISINGTYEVNSNDFRDSSTIHENVEDGQLSTDYQIKGGPAINIAGGATLWRHFGLGVGVSRVSHPTGTTLTASVPHPFFFNRARTVNGTIVDLSRKELAVHVQARGVFPVTPRLDVMLFGGPSFFRVTQGVVTDFSYLENYPYDSASFDAAVTTTAKKSKVGFNAGGDVAFFFSRQVGVGFTAQFDRTSVDLPSASGGTIDVRAGGMQAGGGLRLRF